MARRKLRPRTVGRVAKGKRGDATDGRSPALRRSFTLRLDKVRLDTTRDNVKSPIQSLCEAARGSDTKSATESYSVLHCSFTESGLG